MANLESPFVFVPYSQRQNFITTLSKTNDYKYKIAFVQGNASIPNCIVTRGEIFASVGGDSYTESEIRAIADQEINSYYSYYKDIADTEILSYFDNDGDKAITAADAWDTSFS